MSNVNDKHINKINDMMKFIERNLTCDSDCQREKHIENLRKKWKESQDELRTLPETVLSNEKKFYVTKNGEDYYRNNILRERYTKYIENWRKDQIQKFNDINDIMESTLENYKSETIAKSRINQLLKQVQEKNDLLKKEIDNFYKTTFTAERRVWYQGKDNDNLLSWRFYIKIFYFAVLFAFVLMGPFVQAGGYKSVKMWLFIIFYIALPYILHYIISFFIKSYRYFTRRAPQ